MTVIILIVSNLLLLALYWAARRHARRAAADLIRCRVARARLAADLAATRVELGAVRSAHGLGDGP